MGIGVLGCLMITFNMLFSIIGLAILVFGIVLKFVPDVILKLLETVETPDEIVKQLDSGTLEVAAYVFIVAGSITFLLGFLGCCGAMHENRCMLGLFFGLVLIMCLAELAVAIGAAVYKESLELEIKKIVMNVFNNAIKDPDSDDGKFIHAFEKQFDCCGVDGPGDYNATVPAPACAAISKQGCWASIADFFDRFVNIFIGVGAGVAGLQVLALIMSMVLCCRKTREKY